MRMLPLLLLSPRHRASPRNNRNTNSINNNSISSSTIHTVVHVAATATIATKIATIGLLHSMTMPAEVVMEAAEDADEVETRHYQRG
mmetsp:Transcript_23841/g.66611  ORF Transcript_23841/g.66611 Transcript_23841/m.66611 type:complete len:87 (-) Transcript_23841:121-381(-)